MDHTLAEEMGGRYVIDAARIHHFLYLIVSELVKLHEHGVAHPSLQPANIRVSGIGVELLGVDGPLSRMPPYAAPETIASGKLTAGSNFYSVAILLRELVAGRPALEMAAARVIERCTDRRPSAKEMLGLIEALNWRTGNPPEWRTAFDPHDATEAGLLASLQRDADDAASKQVYADWLEGHGFDTRAAFLRNHEAQLDVDVPWRARFAPAKIDNCLEARCPRTWNKLKPSAYDNQRHCSACRRDVHYCASHADAFAQMKRSERVAVDAALPIEIVHSARVPFVAMPANPPMPMRTWNPPPPQLPPRDPPPPPEEEFAFDNPPRPFDSSSAPRKRWFEFWKKK